MKPPEPFDPEGYSLNDVFVERDGVLVNVSRERRDMDARTSSIVGGMLAGVPPELWLDTADKLEALAHELRTRHALLCGDTDAGAR